MPKEPHEVLGVGRYATEEEIKKAYKELAKKYHPDNYSDPNLAELAGEKMREINEAYEALKNNDFSSEGANTYSRYESYTDSVYTEIRNLINTRHYSEADVKLDAVSESERGAEWHFLKGCLLTQRGWFLDAQKFFETACRMDPQNDEYRQAADSLRNSSNNYTNTWNDQYGRRPENEYCACCPSCGDIMCCLSLDCCMDAMCNNGC